MENISETARFLETNAQNAPVKDVSWTANQVETESIKIQDPGVGRAMILRHFFFKKPPFEDPRLGRPTKQQLVSSFKRLIEATLWADGLIIREDKPIEVHTRKQTKKLSQVLYQEMLKNKADFVIMLLATPRMGVTVRDPFSIAQ